MKPAFKLVANNKNITDQIKAHLESLTLTDKRGLEADQLDIRLNDFEGKLAFPAEGVELHLYLGFEGAALIDKGKYTIESVEETGPPDQLTIRATSADFSTGIKSEKDQAWDGETLGAILATVAGANNLTAAIHPDLADIAIAHIDQTNESDLNFLTRLAKQYDALATIKQNHLLFMPVGSPTTVKGTALKTVTITRSQGDRHSFTKSNRSNEYTGVRAGWRDTAQAETIYEQAGKDGKLKTLHQTFPNPAEAQAAATAKLNQLTRDGHTMTVNLAVGRPELFPNIPVELFGWREQIVNIRWDIAEAAHKLDGRGLTTDLRLEREV